ncbi:MAG: hypothetical protein QN178_12800 [Armatimonadota bacterium]|nr:hypothetical protein [Armatimonadota bacterium]
MSNVAQRDLDHETATAVLLLLTITIAGRLERRKGRQQLSMIGRFLLIFGYGLAGLVSLLRILDWRPLHRLLAVFLESWVFGAIEEALERASAADLLPDGAVLLTRVSLPARTRNAAHG